MPIILFGFVIPAVWAWAMAAAGLWLSWEAGKAITGLLNPAYAAGSSAKDITTSDYWFYSIQALITTAMLAVGGVAILSATAIAVPLVGVKALQECFDVKQNFMGRVQTQTESLIQQSIISSIAHTALFKFAVGAAVASSIQFQILETGDDGFG